MIEPWPIIIIHQVIFQGMFLSKNIILQKKTGKQIRGYNIEANLSICFFALFIGLSIWFSFLDKPLGEFEIFTPIVSKSIGLSFLFLNLIISGASLINLRDSWRVGIIESQKTKLITSGIYRFTRNPYFVSYFLMFLSYTILLQNLVLFGMSIIGFLFVHTMIRKEEIYLYGVHGKKYKEYTEKVPRYLLIKG